MVMMMMMMVIMTMKMRRKIFMTRFHGKTVKVKHIRVVHTEIFLYEHFT